MALSVGRDLFGSQYVIDDVPPTMGVEDLAFYAQRVPTANYSSVTWPSRSSVMAGVRWLPSPMPSEPL